MEKFILDGLEMIDKSRAHEHIAQVLSLPEYYGRNLDALWDCLGEMPAGTSIILVNKESLYMALGDYGKRLVNTFVQAAMENESLSFEVE